MHLLPAPSGDRDAPLKAMLVDQLVRQPIWASSFWCASWTASEKGRQGQMMSNGTSHHVDRIGVFRPQMEMIDELGPGEIGFLTASIKQVRDTRVGDTITHEKNGATALARLQTRTARGVLWAVPRGLCRIRRPARRIDKLALNDASFSFEMETSAALGFGFRCGFLGLLHLEVIRDRIEREYDIELITTAPSVSTTSTCVTAR